MATVLTINIIILVVAAWCGVLYVIPYCGSLRFRDRLWWYRDRLCDDLNAGVYENPRPARMVLDDIENMIQAAPAVTWMKVQLIIREMRRARVFDTDPLNLDSLSHADRTRLERVMDDVIRAMRWKMYAGSVSGWIPLLVNKLADEGKRLSRNLSFGPKPPETPPFREHFVPRDLTPDLARRVAHVAAQRKAHRITASLN